MQTSPLTWLIALMALLFTVGSFWWLHARRGTIKSYSVDAFSGMINGEGLRLHLPIVLHNTGAAPRIVRALRLQGVDAEGKILHLPAQSFKKKLDVQEGGFEDYTHAFVVSGRNVTTKFVTFMAKSFTPIRPGKPMAFTLQAQLDENDHWQGIKTLEVHTGLLLSHYNTWSNDESSWQASTLADGTEHQELLMARWANGVYGKAE